MTNFFQLLHHADAIAPPDDERGSRGAGRYRKDRDDQGPGQGAGHNGVRVQLQRTDGLQVVRKHIQGENY